MDININGITVIFPFKPYDIQVDYMRAVITALQKKQNALLESPTGTGKTLSLLCSSLAWLDHKKFQELDSMKIEPVTKPVSADDFDSGGDYLTQDHQGKGNRGKGKGWKKETPIRIIYCSRTHSQLNQACNELKNSYYKFCQSVTIGSRDQLCINQEVIKLDSGSAKNQACRFKVKNNLCSYHHNYERKLSDLSMCGARIFDIEDLIQFGKEHSACPYYMAKAKSDFNTSLIFMPYNYVLTPSIRKTLKLNLENSVIIFDEGHNIEHVCEDSMSTEIKSDMLALFIKSFDTILLALKQLEDGTYAGTNEKELADLNIHDVAKVKMVICDLEMELDQLVKSDKSSNKGPKETRLIFEIFNRVCLDYSMCGTIANMVEKISDVVMNSTTAYMKNQTIAALNSVVTFLEIVMPFNTEKSSEFEQYKKEFIKNYRLYTEREFENTKQGYFIKNKWSKKPVVDDSTSIWTVHLWCMSPSVAIKSLKRIGIHNLIITSGTLSPLESFEHEMGIPFAIKLQNSHVIPRDQLLIEMVSTDSNGTDLRGTYENRNNNQYHKGVGLCILELARNIPNGIFVFFASYSLINSCIEAWKEDVGVSVWGMISNCKKIFVEPRDKNGFNDAMQSFKETVDTMKQGAIFLAVVRGKLSEGIDLADDYCRAVVMVGQPFPAMMDPKVKLKQEYLNENRCKLNGRGWYMLQMKRALNQAIGRVVRHRNDYGAIILLDSRYPQLQRDSFSKWIIPFLDRNPGQPKFSNTIQKLLRFFSRSGEISTPVSARKPSPDKKIEAAQKSGSPEIILDFDDDDLSQIENVFDNMKKSYTAIKKNVPAPPLKPPNNSQSIFESLNQKNFITSKRKENSNSSLLGTKKICSVQEIRHSTPLNENPKKLISPFLKNLEPLPIDVKLIQDDNPIDVDQSKLQTKNHQEIDLESPEIKSLKENVLKTEKNIKTFDDIMQLIIEVPSKCRQFVETMRIYAKKRNATYLALRLNFILDSLDEKKRISILNDFSSFVPERERKHFLRTCRADEVSGGGGS